MTFGRFDDGKTFYDNGVYVGEVLVDNDGFYKWFPKLAEGYLDEGFLFDMAMFLQELNAPWAAEVDSLLGDPPCPVV